MTDDRRKSLLAELQRRNDEIAEVAAQRVVRAWESALIAQGAPSHAADMAAVRTAPPATAERVAEMVVDGFKRLGPVVGLSVLAEEPGLIVDDMTWLHRAFSTRNMAPPIPGWEAQLLRAYESACSDILPAEDCTLIHDVIERAAADLTSP
ncbi:MAG TPA: hypothetical protein VFR15_11515 [Chloroflexia bacterium]|nr:hypothetical protein [Chloroflexia bacterium]